MDSIHLLLPPTEMRRRDLLIEAEMERQLLFAEATSRGHSHTVSRWRALIQAVQRGLRMTPLSQQPAATRPAALIDLATSSR